MLCRAMLWSLLAHCIISRSRYASWGISQPIDASMAPIPASVCASGQIPQTRDAILGAWCIVLPTHSFSIPLTGVILSQSPRSIIPSSLTLRTSFECPSCLVVGEISTTLDKRIAFHYWFVRSAIPLIAREPSGDLRVRPYQCTTIGDLRLRYIYFVI